MTRSGHDITELLVRWGEGDGRALDELVPFVYEELRRRAGQQLRRERAGHDMGATSLVHLAYMQIRDFPHIPWKNRAQFFCVAANVMWHILIDYARKNRAVKRGGGQPPSPIGEDAEAGEVNPADRKPSLDDVLGLDHPLSKLRQADERQCVVFVLRSGWGFSIKETGELLDISTATVEREHRTALAFLKRELGAAAREGRGDDS
jgi:RNA polymerase sigma factor (TIGR02999 family)